MDSDSTVNFARLVRLGRHGTLQVSLGSPPLYTRLPPSPLYYVAVVPPLEDCTRWLFVESF